MIDLGSILSGWGEAIGNAISGGKPKQPDPEPEPEPATPTADYYDYASEQWSPPTPYQSGPPVEAEPSRDYSPPDWYYPTPAPEPETSPLPSTPDVTIYPPSYTGGDLWGRVEDWTPPEPIVEAKPSPTRADDWLVKLASGLWGQWSPRLPEIPATPFADWLEGKQGQPSPLDRLLFGTQAGDARPRSMGESRYQQAFGVMPGEKPQDSRAAQVLMPEDTTWGRTLRATAGQQAKATAGALEFLGLGEVAGPVRDWAQGEIEKYQDEYPELSPEALTDPYFWQTTALSTVASSVPLMVTGVLLSGAAPVVGGAGLLGTLARGAVQYGGPALVTRTLESLLEAGGTYEQARAENKTDEEASEAARTTFAGNMALLPLDALQLRWALDGLQKPIKRGIVEGLSQQTKQAPGLVARILGIGADVLTEAGEEGYQSAVGQVALGEEVRPDWTAIGLGGLLGFGHGVMGTGVDSARRVAQSRPVPVPGPEVLYQRGEAGGLAPVEAQQTRAAAAMATRPVGIDAEAYGPDPNLAYQFRYRVIDLYEPIVSHADSLQQRNPAFPEDLQPRERGREAARAQVQNIVDKFVPRSYLSDIQQWDKGPMILRSDGLVLSGNGRFLALRKLRYDRPDMYAEYQRQLREILPEYGLTPQEIAGIKDPVIVRELVTPLSPEQLREFVHLANEQGTLAMSSFEAAMSDAGRLSDAAILGLTVGENQSIDRALRMSANRPLVNTFVAAVPENERAAIVDADGDLSPAGYMRLKSAILAKTFPGPAGRVLGETFTESADSLIRNIENGLFASLPAVARAEALVRSGERDAGLSLTEDLAKAVNVLARLKEQGLTAEKYLRQSALWERELNEFQSNLLLWLEDSARSPKVVREVLGDYAASVVESPNPSQGMLFAVDIPTKEALFERAVNKQRAAEEAEYPLFARAAQITAPGQEGQGLAAPGAPGAVPGEGVTEPPVRPSAAPGPGEGEGAPTAQVAPSGIDPTFATLTYGELRDYERSLIREAKELPVPNPRDFERTEDFERAKAEAEQRAQGIQDQLKRLRKQYRLIMTERKARGLPMVPTRDDVMLPPEPVTPEAPIKSGDAVGDQVASPAPPAEPQVVHPRTRAELRQQLLDSGIVSDGEQADYNLALMAGNAQYLGMALDVYIDRFIAGVVKGGTPGKGYLPQIVGDAHPYLDAAKAQFGLTSDLAEAGYITPTGAMISLAGGQRGQRSLPHESVASIVKEQGHQAVHSFLVATGSVRVLYEPRYQEVAFELAGPPTASQRRAIMAQADEDLKRVIIDVVDPRSGMHLKGIVISEPSRTVVSMQLNEAIRTLEKMGALYQADYAPTFYSQLERAVEGIGQPRFSADQLRGMLKKAGVKEDELRWIGVDDLIRQRAVQGKPITKAELLEYIAQNKVEVKEVVRGERPQWQWIAFEEEGVWLSPDQDFRIERTSDNRYDLLAYDLLNGDVLRAGTYPTLEGAQAEAMRYVSDIALPNTRNTKYAQYTLPGGQQYRELLLTLPERPPSQAVISAYERDVNQAAEEIRRYGVDPFRTAHNEMVAAGVPNELARHWGLDLNWGTRIPVEQTGTFVGAHWDEPNVVAHVRFNERVDAEGKRVLFVEEVQSDWMQAAREEGFASAPSATLPDGYAVKEGKDKYQAVYWVADPEGKRVSDLRYAASDAIASFWTEQNRGKVPRAPFAKTWPELAMKRVIRWGAENGFDRVAWTTGKMQAERYDLAKQVKHIAWERNDDGTYNINAPLPDGSPGIYREDLTVSDLRDLVGKEVAEKIVAGEGRLEVSDTGYREWRILSGPDLMVGGQGMLTFYDKMLPEVANKLGKKFGARVGQTRIYTDPMHTFVDFQVVQEPPIPDWGIDAERFVAVAINANGQQIAFSEPLATAQEAQAIVDQLRQDEAPAPSVVPIVSYLEITETMKRSVLQEGQPLFQRGMLPQALADLHLRLQNPEEALRFFNEIGTIPIGDMVTLIGAVRPAYLDGVVRYMAAQRQKTVEGRLTPRELAKAYFLTVFSIGSVERRLDAITREGSKGRRIGLTPERASQLGLDSSPFSYVGPGGERWIRPEEAGAAWLLSAEGKAALDSLTAGPQSGETREAWADRVRVAFRPGELLREAFGDNRFNVYNVFGIKPTRHLTMLDIDILTAAINAAHGDSARISEIVSQANGIGVAKVPFVKHFLGFGDAPTIDTVEVNAWIAGKANLVGGRAKTPREVLAIVLNDTRNAPRIFTQVQTALRERVRQLQKELPGMADVPPEYAEAIMHHWLWDRIKGVASTEEGLQRAMLLAQRDAGQRQPRASIEWTAEGKALIRALHEPNASSLPHELAHLFLEHLKTEDLMVVSRWLEAKGEVRQWSRGKKETFARGFERYLAEGKAPTPELASVFEAFKRWLIEVYRAIKGSPIDVDLTPEVRNVFRKMLGGEAERIEAEVAAASAPVSPTVTEAVEGGPAPVAEAPPVVEPEVGPVAPTEEVPPAAVAAEVQAQRDEEEFMAAFEQITGLPSNLSAGGQGPWLTERNAQALAAAQTAGLSASDKIRAGEGWKIHLNLNRDPQLAADISRWLLERRIPHKVGNSGGQVGKNMTVYVGMRDVVEDLAREIDQQFGAKLGPAAGEVLNDDVALSGRVWGRFEITRLDRDFEHYGGEGFPWTSGAQSIWMGALGKSEAVKVAARQLADAISQATLTERYGASYVGSRHGPLPTYDRRQSARAYNQAVAEYDASQGKGDTRALAIAPEAQARLAENTSLSEEQRRAISALFDRKRAEGDTRPAVELMDELAGQALETGLFGAQLGTRPLLDQAGLSQITQADFLKQKDVQVWKEDGRYLVKLPGEKNPIDVGRATSKQDALKKIHSKAVRKVMDAAASQDPEGPLGVPPEVAREYPSLADQARRWGRADQAEKRQAARPPVTPPRVPTAAPTAGPTVAPTAAPPAVTPPSLPPTTPPTRRLGGPGIPPPPPPRLTPAPAPQPAPQVQLGTQTQAQPTPPAPGLDPGNLVEFVAGLQGNDLVNPSKPLGGVVGEIVRQSLNLVHPVHDFEALAEKVLGRSLRPLEKPSMYRYVMPGAYSAAKEVMDQEYKPILQTVGPDLLPLFSAYLIALDQVDKAAAITRLQARIQAQAAAQGLTPPTFPPRSWPWDTDPARVQATTREILRGVDPVHWQQAMNKMRTLLGAEIFDRLDMKKMRALMQGIGPQQMQTIEQAARDLMAYNHRLLERRLRAGLIDQQTYNDLVQYFPHYVPTHVMKYMETAQRQQGPRRVLSTPDNLLHHLTAEGTTSAQEDPLRAIVELTNSTYYLSMKNEAGSSLVALAESDPNLNRYIREVPDDYDLKNGEGEFFRWDDGERKRYVGLADVVHVYTMEDINLGKFWNAVAWLAREPLKFGATRRNPVFLLTNMAADFANAMMMGEAPQYWAYGVWDVLRHGPATQAFLRSGGGMGKSSMYANKVIEASRHAVKEMASKPWYVVNSPQSLARFVANLATLRPIEDMGNRVELFSRVGGFWQDLTPAQRAQINRRDFTNVPVSATFWGRRVAMDFDVSGEATRLVMRFTPYFNPGIQGAAQIARLLSDPQRRTGAILRLGLFMGAVALLEAYNRRYEEYDDVPQYERDRGLVVMAPWSGQARDPRSGRRIPAYFILAPTREWSAFGIAVRDALRATRGEPWRGPWRTGTALLSSMSPVQLGGEATLLGFFPPAVQTYVEELANRDFFRGKTIVPPDLAALPAAQQYTTYTPESARLLGRLVNVSPLRVQHVIDSNLAVLGRMGLGAVDLVLNAVRRDAPVPRVAAGEQLFGRYVPKQGEMVTVGPEDLDRLRAEALAGQGALYIVSAKDSRSVDDRLWQGEVIESVGVRPDWEGAFIIGKWLSSLYDKGKLPASWAEAPILGGGLRRFYSTRGGQLDEEKDIAADTALGKGTAEQTSLAWRVTIGLLNDAREQQLLIDAAVKRGEKSNVEWKEERRGLQAYKRGVLEGIQVALPQSAIQGERAREYKRIVNTLNGAIQDTRDRAALLAEAYMAIEAPLGADGLPDVPALIADREAYMAALTPSERDAVKGVVRKNATPKEQEYYQAQDLMAQYMAIPKEIGGKYNPDRGAFWDAHPLLDQYFGSTKEVKGTLGGVAATGTQPTAVSVVAPAGTPKATAFHQIKRELEALVDQYYDAGPAQALVDTYGAMSTAERTAYRKANPQGYAAIKGYYDKRDAMLARPENALLAEYMKFYEDMGAREHRIIVEEITDTKTIDIFVQALIENKVRVEGLELPGAAASITATQAATAIKAGTGTAATAKGTTATGAGTTGKAAAAQPSGAISLPGGRTYTRADYLAGRIPGVRAPDWFSGFGSSWSARFGGGQFKGATARVGVYAPAYSPRSPSPARVEYTQRATPGSPLTVVSDIPEVQEHFRTRVAAYLERGEALSASELRLLRQLFQRYPEGETDFAIWVRRHAARLLGITETAALAAV